MDYGIAEDKKGVQVASLTGMPNCSDLTPDQLSELLLHQSAHIAHQRGFPSLDAMIAYEKGRPRYEDGHVVLTDKPNLSHEEALNDHAALHGMPPVGTKTTTKHGIEWEVMNYGFFPIPGGMGRYPNDCDYLPLVYPTNMSERLGKFFNETCHCTSKQILFIDTVPSGHPLKLGEDLHYAISSSHPDESYIFLDVANAHETTFAHEIAHLWLNYVLDGDGMRRLTEEAFGNVKHIQLSFIQSFVVDLKVNDLIADRGFDMSLIREDEINGLTMLRDAIAIGYKPPTSREALLHSISIADCILDQKRWTEEDKERLVVLLEFFATTTPEIYKTAQELVGIVNCHGYDTREAIRKTLDECITLAFRAMGDDFDIERDLEDFNPAESMQDKYPDELPGCPVPLKLEIAKTMARNGVSFPCQIWVNATELGRAQITATEANGVTRGPFEVNYQLIPLHELFNRDFNKPRQLVNGKIPDTFGRLPGGSGYNTACLPGKDQLSQFNQTLANGIPTDEYGRVPGDPGYNTCFAPGHSPFDQVNAMSGMPVANPMRQPWQPTQSNRLNPIANQLPSPNQFNSIWLGTDIMRPYMAGVGLMVARARLAQQIAINNGLDVNAYQYAYNNPVNYVDPSGDIPQLSGYSEMTSSSEDVQCPDQNPGSGDFAIACSKHKSSHISGSFTLPSYCSVPSPDDYINFYLSMGGIEGGVSFSQRNKGWNAFLNTANTGQQNIPMQLTAGQTVHMSLIRAKSGEVTFVINGVSLTGLQRIPLSSVRFVNASQSFSQKCPATHSVAAWNSLAVGGGMNLNPFVQGAEQIVSDSFSSKLRNATLPCDSSQF